MATFPDQSQATNMTRSKNLHQHRKIIIHFIFIILADMVHDILAKLNQKLLHLKY